MITKATVADAPELDRQKLIYWMVQELMRLPSKN